MPRFVVPIVLLLFVLAGGWLLLGNEAPRAAPEPVASPGRAPVTAVEPRRGVDNGDSPAGEPSTAGAKRKDPEQVARARAEREALRERIIASQAARKAAAADSAAAASKRRAAKSGEVADEAPTPGNLVDRDGRHGYLMKVMNEELMPLADECYALARQTRPDLAGLMELEFDILGDEDLGGVVETVALGARSELNDPSLLECMRESILSTTLPAPPAGGSDEVMLSVRFEPDEP